MKVILAYEPKVRDYGRQIGAELQALLGIEVFDANLLLTWSTEIDLIQAVVELMSSDASSPMALLISQSGNGLQMIANKYPSVRAAVLPDARYVLEAVVLNANMVEISACTHTIEQGLDLASEYILAVKSLRNEN